MMKVRRILLLLTALALPAAAAGDADRLIDDAKRRWEDSPHGPMLSRILPPTYQAAQLPEPDSRGALLTVQYCVQCHNLPNPAMHEPGKWPKIVTRMVDRMKGKGNMGTLMKDMMAGVQAPSAEDEKVLVAYLSRHGQKPLDPAKYPDVTADEAKSFRLACRQCHVLPDPKRHRASEWPAIVSRMEQNMLWMNRVVGSKSDPREPQLRVEEIVEYLRRHARKG